MRTERSFSWKARQRSSQAQKVLLFIHGIIGDTKDMAKSVQRAKLAEGGATLKSRYDLVLTFDYENLNTTIEHIRLVLANIPRPRSRDPPSS